MDTSELICCKFCKDILNEPIRLPCNTYICKAHENECEDKRIECTLCNQTHSIPQNGWQIDEIMQNMINHLKMIHNNIFEDENYKKLKEQIHIYENELETYKVKAETPAQMIDEYFSNLILKVDLRSEILKQQIDEISESFKNKINEEKEKCIHLSQANQLIEIDIVKEKERIERSKKQLTSFKVTAFNDLINEINNSINQLKMAQSRLEKNVLNDKEINFLESTENFDQNKFGKLEINSKKKRIIELINEGALIGHSGETWSLAVLPNGDLASGSSDKSIKIWNLEKAREEKTLIGHNSTIYSLVVLINGDLASGSADGSIKIWNVETGAVKRTLRGHNHWVRSLVILPNEDLVSGSEDKTIKIWNVEKSKWKMCLKSHSSGVQSLAVLHNGDLASGSADGTIKIWNVETGTEKRTLTGHTNQVWALAVLQNGDLVSGSWDKTIKIWNVETGIEKKTLVSHSEGVTSLIVLPNGYMVSGSWDKTIKIWNMRHKKVIRTEGHISNVCSQAFLEYGYLVSGFEDGTIRYSLIKIS